MASQTTNQSIPIDQFHGDFDFLSNYYPCAISIDGHIYPTAEHAFQALKTDNPEQRAWVQTAPTPAAAKSRGQQVTLRANWNSDKFPAMERVVRAKFADPDLAEMLVATGERKLIEGNTWGDYTWGCVRDSSGKWVGRNGLGKLLMAIRAELRDRGACKS